MSVRRLQIINLAVVLSLIVFGAMFYPSSAKANQTALLTKCWQVGHDDEFIFGLIFDLAVDPAGYVYVLDRQLVEVQVFSPEGEFVRVLSQEGDGPGEFRYPSGLMIDSDRNIGVIESSPAAIHMLNANGDPLGTLPLPDPVLGNRLFASNARSVSDGLVLYANYVYTHPDRTFERLDAIIKIGGQGDVMAWYCDSSHFRPQGDAHYFENSLVGFEKWIWCVDIHDRIFVNRTWDKYEIEVYKPDGEIQQTIRRNEGPRLRSKEFYEKKKRYHAEEIVGSHSDGKQITFDVSTTDRTVQGIYPRPDGSVWILSSFGAFDTDEGMLCSVDVFSRDSEYSGRIAFQAPGDLREDKLFIVGNRVYLIVNYMAAIATIKGGGWSGDEQAVEPMSVICYQIPDLGSP